MQSHSWRHRSEEGGEVRRCELAPNPAADPFHLFDRRRVLLQNLPFHLNWIEIRTLTRPSLQKPDPAGRVPFFGEAGPVTGRAIFHQQWSRMRMLLEEAVEVGFPDGMDVFFRVDEYEGGFE